MQLLTLSQLQHHLKHRLQTLLAILGVALGVAVVNAVDITQYSAKQNLLRAQQQLNGVASHRIVGAADTINETIYAQLRRDLLSRYPEIQLTPVLKHTVKGNPPNNREWVLLGIDPLSSTTLSFSNKSTFKPTPEGQSSSASWVRDFLVRKNAVLISQALAAEKSLSIGESFFLSLPDHDRELWVAGIFDNTINPNNQQLIVMDIGNVQTNFNRTGVLTSIDVHIPANQPQLIEKIRRVLPASTRLLSVEQLVAGQLSLINALQFNLSALSFLCVVVGALLIFSTVRFSILQRIPSFCPSACTGCNLTRAACAARQGGTTVVGFGYHYGLAAGILPKPYYRADWPPYNHQPLRY